MADELKQYLAENTSYNNFAEEVAVSGETKAGNGLSLYTVVNKNGVTFQTVPGNPGITDRGTMGYINGDRGRPVVFGPAAKVEPTFPGGGGGFFGGAGGGPDGPYGDGGEWQGDIQGGPSFVEYDINLDVWTKTGTCNANDVETPFVIVQKL